MGGDAEAGGGKGKGGQEEICEKIGKLDVKKKLGAFQAREEEGKGCWIG